MKYSISVKLSITLALAALAGAFVLSAAPTPYPEHAILNRPNVLAASDAVTTNEYPNANTVLLDEHIFVSYEPNGANQSWDDEYIKILTEKGRRETRTLSLHFDIHYTRINPLLIEIIKPDGRVIAVDIEKQSRIMTDPSQMDANIYNPDNKVMQIAIPGLEVGDICHYRIHRNNFKARMADTFSDYRVFEYTSPIRRMVYEIDAPKDEPIRSVGLKAAIDATVASMTEERGDRIRYRWEVRDVPRMYKEPRMPTLHTVVQRLLVSTIPDWETVSKWYWQLSLPRLAATTPTMRAKVDELVAGAEDDMQKVRRIFRFVSQEIRYMGITTEDEAPGYEPHDVSITFGNRYGVCRDKAALLVAMLRMADLDSYPVLIHAGPKKDEEVPQPYFNHAITAVELTPGEYILMDPTDENTRDLLPNYLCNKSFLVAKPEGEKLMTSPIVPAEENLVRIESRGRMGAERVLKIDSTISFEGVNDSVYRGFFARQKPEDIRKYFEKLLRRSLPGSTLTDFGIAPENLLDTEIPLTIELSFKNGDSIAAGERLALFNPPWIGRLFGMANIILRGTGLEERKYPLATDIACGIDESFEIALADSNLESLQMPEDVNVDTGKISFRRAYSDLDGLSGNSTLLLKAVEFLPEDYLELKQLLADREIAQRAKPLYRSESGHTRTPDVRILSRETEVELVDAGEWRTRITESKEILTYAGKKRNSELKIDYNPAWQSVLLESVKVTNADGSVFNISDDEINIMDAPWTASAPRYPEAKRLVASLPGVEKGSIVETSILFENRDKPFFSFNWSPNGYDPVDSTRLTVSIPADEELKISELGLGTVDPDLFGAATETNSNRVTHSWNFESLPGLKNEQSTPPWWTFNPTVFISNGDWSEYARDLQPILAAAAKNQTRAISIAKDLTADLPAPDAAIKAIRDYVAEAITAAGPGLPELPFDAITPADEVIASGYGNTSDRAVVLYAMLAAVGLEPEFVLASSTGSRIAEVREPQLLSPSRPLFDTVLVGIEGDDGRVYLNDSNQYDAIGATDFDGRPGLTMGGEQIVIEALAEKRNRFHVEYDIEVAANGDADIDYERHYYGTVFGDFHRRYAEMSPEERRRHYQKMVSSLSESATASSGLQTDFSSYPGTESFRAAIDSYAVHDGKYLYFELPRELETAVPAVADTRAHPLYQAAPTQSRAKYEIVLPASTARYALLPKEFEWNGPTDMGKVEFDAEMRTMDDGRKTIDFERRIDFEPAVIPAADYNELIGINARISRPSAWMIILEMND